MKKKLLTMALTATMLVLAGCRQGQGSEGQMSTFSQGTATTAATQEQTRRQPATTAVTALELMKQRVARGTSEIMLVRKGYTTSYNKRTLTPNWVAWALTKEHTYGRLQRDNERFEEDTDVAQPRATYQDYYNSRYDRGHMCPAGDNKWDQQAMTESFLMTNICPQNHGLNKDDWNELEMQCRTWARRYGELTIVCGPLFEDGQGQQRTIGRNRVSVPSGFFKVVCRLKPQPQALGFIFKNDGSRQPWREQAVAVDEVERRSGIDFFLMLPDDVEQRIEATCDLGQW